MAVVWYVPVDSGENKDSVGKKVARLFKEARFHDCFDERDLVAIKMHFGEKGNDTHVPPEYVRPVVRAIKDGGGNPFLTDTCVLYKSKRDNAADHIRVASDHGFTIGKVGAPVIIADGLLGREERDVAIPGKLFKEVSVASLAIDANALFVLTHVTGHMGTGIGGTIKNLGMGFASRKGKLRQHSVMKPEISEKSCTGCGVCLEWCPEDTIAMPGETARIDSERCIGCGECLTVCRFDAVKFDWRMREFDLQQRMAEHALGAVIGKKGKAGYMNFIVSVTKDCDCFGVKQTPLFDDIGIVASHDPVAVDAASLDLIRERTGKELTEISYPHIDPRIQLQHGQQIDLGSTSYELRTVI